MAMRVDVVSKDGAGFASFSVDPGGSCDPLDCTTNDAGVTTRCGFPVHRAGRCSIHATRPSGERIDREINIREAEGVCCAGPRVDDPSLPETGWTLEL